MGHSNSSPPNPKIKPGVNVKENPGHFLQSRHSCKIFCRPYGLFSHPYAVGKNFDCPQNIHNNVWLGTQVYRALIKQKFLEGPAPRRGGPISAFKKPPGCRRQLFPIANGKKFLLFKSSFFKNEFPLDKITKPEQQDFHDDFG